MAGERNLGFRIGATDDATAVFAKLARAAKSSMADVQGDLDDTRTAGKRMADALTAVADELDRELEGTARAADKLAEALGPDLAAKLNDGDLDRFVSDLRAAGLSIEEIEADAEQLATALKRMDDVHVQASGRLRQGFDDVGDAARRSGGGVDKTRSVVANFAGNAVQDIPGVSGAFGALNVAAGQFAEYAAEGDISLRNFARSVGPLGLATVAITAVVSAMAEASKANAFRADQVEDWTRSVREGSQVVQLLREQIGQTGKLEIPVKVDLGDNNDPFDWIEDQLGFDETATQIRDLLPVLHNLGLSVNDFARLTGASDEQLGRWREQMIAAGHDARTVDDAVLGVTGAQTQYRTATENAAIITDVLADSTESNNQAMERANRLLEEGRRRYEELVAARERSLGNDLDLQDAMVASARALERYNETLADTEASELDKIEAGNSLIDTYLAQGESARQRAEDEAVAAGDAANATELGTQAQVVSLLQLADNLGPDSELRRQLLEHIRILNEDVPRDITTRVRMDLSELEELRRRYPNIPPPISSSRDLAAVTDGVVIYQTVNGRLTADEQAEVTAAAREAANQVNRIVAIRAS